MIKSISLKDFIVYHFVILFIVIVSQYIIYVMTDEFAGKYFLNWQLSNDPMINIGIGILALASLGSLYLVAGRFKDLQIPPIFALACLIPYVGKFVPLLCLFSNKPKFLNS